MPSSAGGGYGSGFGFGAVVSEPLPKARRRRLEMTPIVLPPIGPPIDQPESAPPAELIGAPILAPAPVPQLRAASASHPSSPHSHPPGAFVIPATPNVALATTGRALTVTSDKHMHVTHATMDAIKEDAKDKGDSQGPCRGRRGGLMMVFVGIAFCQVVLACFLIWYIGYRSQLQTVDSLSSQLRASVLHDCVTQVNTELIDTLRASQLLLSKIDVHFPNFSERLTLTNETGWLADMTFMGALYPRITRFGLANKLSTTMTLTRPSSLTPFAVLSDTGLSGMFVSNGSTTTDISNLVTYQTTPIHSSADYKPPFNIVGEVLNTDSPADIWRYLGANTSQNTAYNLKQRAFWLGAEEVATIGQTAFWTVPYYALPTPQDDGFVVLQANSFVLNPVDHSVEWLTWASISARDFAPFLAALPFGSHGRAYMMHPGGGCMSSSDTALNAIIDSTKAEIDLFATNDVWLLRLRPMLLRANLISSAPMSLLNASIVVPYRTTVYEQSFSVDGASYLMQAEMTNNATTGSTWFIVLVTKDADFNGNVRDAIVTTLWLSALVCFAAIVVSSLVTSCVTRPLMRVVGFMERAVAVIAMARGEEQRAQLGQLCTDWSADTHTANVIRTKATGAGLMHEPEALPITEEDKSAACRILCCINVGRSLREVDLMHRSFGSMLFSLASYDELEAINQAKRAFIRYIFHEVRVPFNAIVLGIEQMQIELKAHLRSSPACSQLTSVLDTMTIVHEQGEVVSRILNDVLSMQKIEDGALTLDLSSFDLGKMVRVALHAFRVPCSEKRLKVTTMFADLDAIIEERRDEVPILAAHPDLRLGTQFANEDGSSWHVHVEADPYRLRQALANFISNAIKFSRVEGQIEVGVEFGSFVPARNEDDNGDDDEEPLSGDALAKSPSPPKHAALGNGATPRRSPDNMYNDASPSAVPVLPNHERAVSEEDGCKSEDDEECADDHFDLNAELSGRFVGSVAITVRCRDSGVGLSAENAQQMFQQYAQVSANKNQAGGGTGLGLSISKSIVELHGGQIGVTSAEGEGSEFFFIVPNTRVILAKVDGHASLGTCSRSDSRSRSRMTRDSHNTSVNGVSLTGNSSGLGHVSSRTHIDLRRTAAANAAANNSANSGVPALQPLSGPGTNSNSHSHRDSQRAARRSSSSSRSSGHPHVLVHTGSSGSSAGVAAAPKTPNMVSAAPNPSESPEIVSSDSWAVRFHEDTGASTPAQAAAMLTAAASAQPTVTVTSPSDAADNNTSLPAHGQGHDRHSTYGERVSLRRTLRIGRAPSLPSLTKGAFEMSGTHSGRDGDRDQTSSETEQSVFAIDSPHPGHGGLASATSSLASTPSMSLVSPSDAHNNGLRSHSQTVLSSHRRLDSGTANGHLPHPSSGSPVPGWATLVPDFSSNLVLASESPLTRPRGVRTHSTGTIVAAAAEAGPTASAVPASSPPIPDAKLKSSSRTGTTGSSSSSSSSRQHPIRVGARVLVVEDSMPNRKLLLAILQHMKLISSGVENGQECVDLFPVDQHTSEQPFDCIIMDGNMPVMNGVEACRILRSRGVSVPILALTGNALAEDVASFLTAGATSVLTKPINRAQLQQALAMHLPPLTAQDVARRRAQQQQQAQHT